MKIVAITINYKNPDMTLHCIQSFLEHDNSIDEVIIVNNDDVDFPVISNKYKKNIHTINNHKNVGFAGGVNIGIDYALKNGADYILLINNDTIISKPICHDLLACFQEKKDAGIVGPSIRFVKNGQTLYDLGGYISLFWGRTYHDEVTICEDEPIREVTYMSGCCMLIKKEVFAYVKSFDESYFLYYEDVDFCLRASSFGFKIYVVPSCVIDHQLSKTVGKLSKTAVYHQTRSALIFAKKRLGIQKIMFLFFILAQSFLFLKKDFKNGIYAFVAIWDTIRNNKS